MHRGPLIQILKQMSGTDNELNLLIAGESQPMEIRNVVDVEELISPNGIKVITKQNNIWLDSSHVSGAWQVRLDLDGGSRG